MSVEWLGAIWTVLCVVGVVYGVFNEWERAKMNADDIVIVLIVGTLCVVAIYAAWRFFP